MKDRKMKFIFNLNLGLLMVFLLTTIVLDAQEVCFNYRGEWSSWASCPGKISKYIDDSGLILRTTGGTEFFKFHINNFSRPTKDELKNAKKTGKWLFYRGVVEYFVNDKYPTAEEFCKANTFVIPNPRRDETPNVKRETSCTIKIAPFKKHPEIYFIEFDNVAIEISIKGLNWN